MRFKRLNSFLDDVDASSQSPKSITASFKRAEKYLHRRVIHYLENNNEKELAAAGNKLLNLLSSSSDIINTATDDEIEYSLDEIRSKARTFDKKMRRVIITPTVTGKEGVKGSSATKEKWRNFTKRNVTTKPPPIRKNIEMLRMPIVFLSVKNNMSWGKKIQDIKNKGFDIVVYDRYPVLKNELVLFVKKDFPPLINYIESNDSMDDYVDDKTWRKLKRMDRMNMFFYTILSGLTSTRRANEDDWLRAPNYWVDDGMAPISHDKYFAQWVMSVKRQNKLSNYFGKIKTWKVADDDSF